MNEFLRLLDQAFRVIQGLPKPLAAFVAGILLLRIAIDQVRSFRAAGPSSAGTDVAYLLMACASILYVVR